MPKATKASNFPATLKGIRALHVAAVRDDVEMARRALNAGARVNGRADDIHELVSEEGDDECSGLPGATPLFRAACAGSAGVVRLLLEHGASVDLDSTEETPLTVAARKGHLGIVRTLVEAGADVNHLTWDRMTALSAAVGAKKTKVAAYLRKHTGVSVIDALHIIARSYAKRYSGTVTPEQGSIAGAPPCWYAVTGKHRGRWFKFRIFDGGCIVEGETARIADAAISVNGKAIRADVAVSRVGSAATPRLFRDDRITDKDARATLAKLAAQGLEALRLGRGELLAIDSREHFGYSKRPTFFLVHRDTDGPDFARLDARLDVLATLLPWRVKRTVAPEVPVFSTNAYRIGVGARLKSGDSGARHVYGGTLDHELACRNCKSPIHLLLTIDTRASELKLPSLGRPDFRIVYCLNCMSFPGLLYIDYSKPKLRIIKQDKELRFNDDGPIPGRRVTLMKLEPASRSASKIGGTPNWLQNAAIPACARCRKRMVFLAQLQSRPDLSFVDDGTLYTFVCTRCKVTATLVQSH